MNGSLTYKDIETFINYIFSGNINEVISLINTFNNKGKNLVLVINQIINYVRNCIVDNYISGKKINNVSLYIDFVNYFENELPNENEMMTTRRDARAAPHSQRAACEGTYRRAAHARFDKPRRGGEGREPEWPGCS